MHVETLEQELARKVAHGHTGPAELRDALTAYLALASGRSLEASRRVVRLKLPSELPRAAELSELRRSIERSHPPRPADGLQRLRRLLDEMGLRLTVQERLQTLPTPRRRRMVVYEGGQESSPPSGRLRIVAAAKAEGRVEAPGLRSRRGRRTP